MRSLLGNRRGPDRISLSSCGDMKVKGKQNRRALVIRQQRMICERDGLHILPSSSLTYDMNLRGYTRLEG